MNTLYSVECESNTSAYSLLAFRYTGDSKVIVVGTVPSSLTLTKEGSIDTREKGRIFSEGVPSLVSLNSQRTGILSSFVLKNTSTLVT